MIVLFGEFNHWYVPFWIFVFDDLVFQIFFFLEFNTSRRIWHVGCVLWMI